MSKILKRVVLKEELVALTGCPIKAMILNQLLYWQERTNDVDKYITEEQERSQYDNNTNIIPLTNGWIYKGAEDLANELMNIQVPRNIARKLKDLVNDGFIESRHNPYKSWDKKMQYRVNMVKVIADLQKLGYALEGYALLSKISDINNGLSSPQSNTVADNSLETIVTTVEHHVQSARHIDLSIRQNVPSVGHTVHSDGHDVGSNRHDVSTIPENSIYNTPESNLSVINECQPNRLTEGLTFIKTKCQLEIIEAEYGRDMRQIINNALEMMYYAQTLRVGNSIIPQDTVRSRMYGLHCSILLYAIDKAKYNTKNTNKIKRSTNYLMSAIYNAITEYHSDVEFDPDLNQNRLVPMCQDHY